MANSLLERDVVVVRQKAKIIEVTNQYGLEDTEGNAIGSVNEVGQSTVRKAVRLFSQVDQYLSHRLEVHDADGATVLTLYRPPKLMKSKVEVTDAGGEALGTIVQENVVGKKRFALNDAGGTRVGTLVAENWRAWDFRIFDTTEAVVGTVNKQFSGLLREAFTTADTYVVQLESSLSGSLRPLAFAAAVAIDTALKQDD
jgi:uncharacterized protein YxjI